MVTIFFNIFGQTYEKVTERKAKELKAKALQSVATLSGEIPSLMVSRHCKSIMQLNKEIEKLKGVLIARYEDNEDLQRLIVKLFSNHRIMNIKIIFVLLALSNHFGCKQSNELNLNFERIHQSKIDEWKTSGFNIVIDSLNPYEGNYSIILDTSQNILTNTIQIDESKTSNIEIEFRYKTSKSKNDSVAILLHNIFPTQDINQKSQYFTDEINLPCDDKWSTYHNVIAGRKGYKIYSFAVENKSTERIWLDDFRISINGKQCKKYVFFSEKDYQKLQSEIEPIDIVQLNEHQFESLSKGIQDKKLVTLGESTHGTKEVNLIKNAIIKQLVKKHNFNYIIFEGNMGSLEDANNFLLNDPINGVEKALSKLFAVFQTKEVEELFTWIQKYNISKPLTDKIQLKGCDIQDEIDVLDKLMKFAKRTDSDLESLLSLFSKEYKVPERLDLIMKIKNRLAKIEANNNKIYRNEIQYGNLLEQFVIKDANIGLPGYRDSCMASNIKWILDSGPKIKAIFWAHNIHVQKQFVAAPGMNDEVKSKGIKLTTGQFLDDLIPSQQFVVGFALNEGTYRAKWKDRFDVCKLEKPQILTYEFLFNIVNDACYYISVNSLKTLQVFKDKRMFRVIGAEKLNNQFFPANLTESFDAIIFIEKSNASIPL